MKNERSLKVSRRRWKGSKGNVRNDERMILELEVCCEACSWLPGKKELIKRRNKNMKTVIFTFSSVLMHLTFSLSSANRHRITTQTATAPSRATGTTRAGPHTLRSAWADISAICCVFCVRAASSASVFVFSDDWRMLKGPAPSYLLMHSQSRAYCTSSFRYMSLRHFPLGR